MSRSIVAPVERVVKCPRAGYCSPSAAHSALRKVGGKHHHVPLVDAGSIVRARQCVDDFFVGRALSAQFEHLYVVSLQLVAILRVHQFACQRLHLIIIVFAYRRFVQVQAYQQHLGKPAAEPPVFRFAGHGQVFGGEQEVVFYELHLLFAREPGQRLFFQRVL